MKSCKRGTKIRGKTLHKYYYQQMSHPKTLIKFPIFSCLYKIKNSERAIKSNVKVTHKHNTWHACNPKNHKISTPFDIKSSLTNFNKIYHFN